MAFHNRHELYLKHLYNWFYKWGKIQANNWGWINCSSRNDVVAASVYLIYVWTWVDEEDRHWLTKSCYGMVGLETKKASGKQQRAPGLSSFSSTYNVLPSWRTQAEASDGSVVPLAMILDQDPWLSHTNSRNASQNNTRNRFDPSIDGAGQGEGSIRFQDHDWGYTGRWRASGPVTIARRASLGGGNSWKGQD